MESNPTTAVNWQTPAGRLLDRLAAALPKDPPALSVIVFGSAVLQMTLEPAFLSRDVDIVGDEEDVIRHNALELVTAEERLDLAFQVCDALTFRTAQGWEARARREIRSGHAFIFPHPWDILVSKIGRLEEKDLEAFRLVIRKTGGPTAAEFARHLQLAVDLFRPNFDEERGADYATQTRQLWRTIYDAEIDVRTEIIRPALARRQAQYDADAGDPAWKDRLRRLGGD
jgi:hypothetical protein